MRTVLLVYGTRPEAIKMAPLVLELERSATVTPVVAVTGQHREMLDQVNRLFGITPRHDLDIISPRQTLTDVTTRALHGLSEVVARELPDAVVVQGDTTTAFVGALAAFYARVPVVHLEAGLRTDNPYSPFPEEINRRLTAQLAAVHLAPTQTSRDNLLREGIRERSITVTGNTVIDALRSAVELRVPYADPDLRDRIGGDERVVLVTAHRRESWGQPMASIARAVARLAETQPEVLFVLPAHRNPVVREVLLPPLKGLDNVTITEPLGYGEFARLIAESTMILTDSGGLQEEGPSLGKPVLVMREETERPEAVTAGTVRLVGTDADTIVAEVTRLLTDGAAYDAMARAVNPYGDGRAAQRAARAIEALLGVGERLPDFTAQPSL